MLIHNTSLCFNANHLVLANNESLGYKTHSATILFECSERFGGVEVRFKIVEHPKTDI
jgi:hypothetical protein